MDNTAISSLQYKLIYTDNTVCIKGAYHIASYDETIVIINCGKDNICITGESIFIASLSADEIHICGNINSISFA